MGTWSRREFLKIGSAGAAAFGVGSGLLTRWWGLDGDALADPGTDGDRVVATFCELCFWKCGVLAHVKDGRVTKLVGNPAHPLSRGRLCPRGAGGTGLLYDPDRLKTPLVRTEARGRQAFREATWDEALDLVAGGLRKVRDRHGPEALALFLHGHGGSFFQDLVRAYGSANIAAPSYAQCRGPRDAAFTATFGSAVGSPETLDLERSRCITLLGSHLGENMHNTQVQELADALDGGAGLVVVDPRFSVIAGKAHHWLPIKPGTDLALLLAWMHVIVAEGLYDRDYVAKHTTGFEALRKHLEDKTPEWAWTLTSISPERIRETARFIAAARPASLVHPGRHTTWYGDDTQRSRAVAILNALLGSWGRRGGLFAPVKTDVPKLAVPTHSHEPKATADVPKGGGYPLADEVLASGLRDASLPGTADYDIKAWLIYGTNLVQSLPDPEKTRKALQALDLVVTVDVLPVEIAGWSDVVLPEATYLERWDDVHTPPWKTPFVAVRQPVVEPMYGSKPGWWIARELARRLGLSAWLPWSDAEDLARRRIAGAKLDWRALLETGVLVGAPQAITEEDGLELSFATPSGKIELWSKALAEAGQPPLPEFTPPEEPPLGMYRLLFGRAPTHSFGRTVNNRLLSEVFPTNTVWVAEATCAEQGLEDGDLVMLVNQDGARSGPVAVKRTQRIRPDCVYMVHGFGRDAKGLTRAHGKGASDSELVTKSRTDPAMGGTGMNVNFVRMERA